MKEILKYCKLFKGLGISHALPETMGNYDILMPTIEFHPNHSHNTEHKSIPEELWPMSVFWVVDNEENLDLAASLRPDGIVSNTPKDIISIIHSDKWCDEK